MHVLSIDSILRRLPVVQAGETETIPFDYRCGSRSGALSLQANNHYLDSADSGRALVWSRRNEVQCVTFQVSNYALQQHYYDNIIYDKIVYYY